MAGKEVTRSTSASALLENLACTGTKPGSTEIINVVCTITSLSYDGAGGLFATGECNGVGFVNEIIRIFADPDNPAVCNVLLLDLKGLLLNVLGLTIKLNPVVLVIDAASGAGNLLGNLLCALVGLLDGGLFDLLGDDGNVLGGLGLPVLGPLSSLGGLPLLSIVINKLLIDINALLAHLVCQ
jgi:hypothetical protein